MTPPDEPDDPNPSTVPDEAPMREIGRVVFGIHYPEDEQDAEGVDSV